MRLNKTDFANLLVSIGGGIKYFANSLTGTFKGGSTQRDAAPQSGRKNRRSTS